MTDDPPKDPPRDAPPSVEVSPEAFEPQPSRELAAAPEAPEPPATDAPQTTADATADAPDAAAEPPADDALLPAAYDDSALRDAVGAPAPRARRKRKQDDDDGDGPGKLLGRRGMLVGAIILVTGLVVATFAVLGHANAQRYAITCAADRVTAEQGRKFPPWGTRPMVGAEWRPIALPPNAECKPRETNSRAELEGWYLDLLVDRASTTLTAHDLLEPVPAGTPNRLDLAADQLEQALLLSRTPERRDERKEVERLLGDVTYWRASLRLRDASTGLSEAARQFEAAAAKRPRHVTDSAEWAAFLQRVVDELNAGPGGVPAAATVPGPVEPPSERPPAPPGEALPVEPEPEPTPETEPAPAPDADLPTGGVLL